jgi:hypothetical protein
MTNKDTIAEWHAIELLLLLIGLIMIGFFNNLYGYLVMSAGFSVSLVTGYYIQKLRD